MQFIKTLYHKMFLSLNLNPQCNPISFCIKDALLSPGLGLELMFAHVHAIEVFT